MHKVPSQIPVALNKHTRKNYTQFSFIYRLDYYFSGEYFFFFMRSLGAEDTAQKLKSHVVLADNLDSVPSTHTE